MADNFAAIYMSRMPENVGALISRNPKGLDGLYRANFTFRDELNYPYEVK
jgi:hypothetical protein